MLYILKLSWVRDILRNHVLPTFILHMTFTALEISGQYEACTRYPLVWQHGPVLRSPKVIRAESGGRFRDSDIPRGAERRKRR